MWEFQEKEKTERPRVWLMTQNGQHPLYIFLILKHILNHFNLFLIMEPDTYITLPWKEQKYYLFFYVGANGKHMMTFHLFLPCAMFHPFLNIRRRHTAFISAAVTCHHFAIMQAKLLKCSFASRDFLVYTPPEDLFAPWWRRVGARKPVHR